MRLRLDFGPSDPAKDDKTTVSEPKQTKDVVEKKSLEPNALVQKDVAPVARHAQNDAAPALVLRHEQKQYVMRTVWEAPPLGEVKVEPTEPKDPWSGRNPLPELDPNEPELQTAAATEVKPETILPWTVDSAMQEVTGKSSSQSTIAGVKVEAVEEKQPRESEDGGTSVLPTTTSAVEAPLWLRDDAMQELSCVESGEYTPNFHCFL